MSPFQPSLSFRSSCLHFTLSFLPFLYSLSMASFLPFPLHYPFVPLPPSLSSPWSHFILTLSLSISFSLLSSRLSPSSCSFLSYLLSSLPAIRLYPFCLYPSSCPSSTFSPAPHHIPTPVYIPPSALFDCVIEAHAERDRVTRSGWYERSCWEAVVAVRPAQVRSL